MPTQTLTDARCRSAKPGAKLIKMFGGGGMHLAVLPSGVKVWRIAYRLNGKPKTISIGPYPDVSLAQARTKLADVKAVLRDGGDPMAQRSVRRGPGLTIEQGCRAYWAGRGDIRTGYRDNALRAMELHVFPFIGGVPVRAATRQDLMNVLDRMDAAKKHVYLRKVRMWLGLMFDWAIARHDAEINPASQIDPGKAFGKSKVVHFNALTLQDMPAFMQRLKMEADIQSVLACRFLAYTWLRTVEVRFLAKAEIEGDLLRIPAERMKRDRDHLVPLPTQAVAILKQMQSRDRGGPYVFASEFRTDRPISENTILYLLYRMGYKGRMTGHGFRSVGSTWANERGYRADAIERQLSHAPDDDTRAAYNRAEFMPERKAMLQAWADWLDSCQIDAGSPQR